MKNEKATITIPRLLRARINARVRLTEYSMAELIRRWIEKGIDEDE